MNILIVIEDPKFRQALDSFLRSEAVQPVTTSGLQEARASGIPIPIDLVFASEALEELAPAATLDAVRAIPGAEQARIVAVSSSRSPALRALYEAGFDGIVGPGSSADEIASHAILAVRARPAVWMPDEPGADASEPAGAEPTIQEDESTQERDVAAETDYTADTIELVDIVLPPVLSERGRTILATLKTLGFYLARQAPVERQAQHALRAIETLWPGLPAAILLRPRDSHGWMLAPGADVTPEFVEIAYNCYGSLTDADWDHLALEPRFVSREQSDSSLFAPLLTPELFDGALHVALSSSERTLGVLAVYFDEHAEPEPHDIIAFETIASMTAVAIAHGAVAAVEVRADETIDDDEQEDDGSSELPWEQIFEHFPVAAFLVDENGLFVATNDALSVLCGATPDEMRRLSIFDVLAEHDTLPVSEHLTAIAEQESSTPVDVAVGVVTDEDQIAPSILTLRGLAPESWHGAALIQGVLRAAARDDAREAARLESLQDIARIVATEREIDSAANGVLAALSQRLGYPRAAIWTIDTEGTRLQRRASLTEDLPASCPIDDGIAGRAFRTWQPEFTEAASGGHESSGGRVCVPIVHADRIFGVLDIEGGDDSPLRPRDLSFFAPIAAQIAGIIERDSLYQHLEHQAMTDQVTGLPNRQVFQEQLDATVASLSAGTVSVLVLGVDGFKQVNELYGHTIADEVLQQIGAELRARMSPEHLLARYTSDQFVALLPGVDRDDAVNLAEDLRIGLATHLFTIAEQVEQLTVSIGAATCPDDAETSRSLLQAADHAMYLAKRAGRNQTFQSNAAFATLAPAHGRINDLLRQSPRETLSLLIRAMDQRLPERAGHSERVTRYALAIARELGLPDAELPRVRLAAYIHDIGMVSLPDALLRKPSQLSPEERGLLRGVPVAAHGLLSQLDLNESVLMSVLHQRENFDGTGYPSGLRGDSIPLGARIIAVADALDAMTSVRAHRQPMTLDQALDQVSQQAGRQFDPEVVKAAYCLTDVISEPVSIPARDDDRPAERAQVMTGVTGELRM